jgi:hypothetical protein
MSYNQSIALPDVFQGDTWDGLTWEIESVDANATEHAGTLQKAVFRLTDSTGAVALNLDSDDVADGVTLNNTAPNAWSVTIEPRVITLAAGSYSWALRMFDNSSAPERRKVNIFGALRVKADPA